MHRWLPILALCGVAACVNTNTSRLRGRVVDCHTQTPVEGANVQLTAPETGASWNSVETADDGSFAFDMPLEARGARLTVTAEKSGYQSAQKTYPSVPAGAQD